MAIFKRRKTRPSKPRGAVLVITLLATLLLAALVFYVINLGMSVDKRVIAQQVADSTAIDGAGWTARSLNTVAMNNVAMARLVALTSTLDSMPLASLFTYKEELDNVTQTNSQGLSQALQDQLGRGVTDWWMRDKLQEMLNNIGTTANSQQSGRVQELHVLEQFLGMFNAVAGDTTDQQINAAIQWQDPNAFNGPTGDVTAMTFYSYAGGPSTYGSGAPGPGQIWQAMAALDQFNQATADNLTLMAYVNAIQGGRTNLDFETHMAGVTVADVNGIPLKRGSFADFQRPVTQGLLPNGVDDKITNRGPFDTIFGWRDPARGGWNTPGHSVNTSVVSGSGNVPIGRGGDSDWVSTGPTSWSMGTTYSVYGPNEWMMRRMHDLRRASLPYSRFDHWMRTISNIKLSYAWGGGPQTIIDPKWVDTFPEAATMAQQNPSQVVETAFVIVEIKSRSPIDQVPPTNGPAPAGQAPTWAYVTRNRPAVPWVARLPGWVDPRTWAAPMTDDYIWRDQWVEMVNYDHDIGIDPMYDAQGRIVPQPVYRTDEYMFAGINVGTAVVVRNPFNFTGQTTLPAPIDLDHAQLPPSDNHARWSSLNCLAVTRLGDGATYWPDKFGAAKPYPYATAIAQAEVFNDHSWDLWTQMWHAQLAQVSYFGEWSGRFQSSGNNTRYDPPGVQDDTVNFLNNMQSLAPILLSH